MKKHTLTAVALVILTGIGAETCWAQGYRGGRGSQRQMGSRSYSGARWQDQSRWNDPGWQTYPQQNVQLQQQLNEIGREFQFQTEMDKLRRERNEVRNQGAVQNFFLEEQRKRLKEQQWRLEQERQKQMNQQQSGTKPYPRLERPRTADQNFVDARKELGRELSNGRKAVGRELSNGRQAAGRELSNGRQAVGRELSNGRRAVGREASNARDSVSRGLNSLFGR